jgi:ferric-dicitrate binding protein FerR (iron transport regulator)
MKGPNMDKHRQARFQFLLHKYVDNKCSAKELDELFQLLKEHPNSGALKTMIDGEAEKFNLPDETIPEEISQSILLSLNRKLRGRDFLYEKNKKRFERQQYMKIAATFLLVAICTAVLFLYLAQTQSEYVEIRTAYGEIKSISLPDSSKVVLNGNSTIRYATAWDKQDDRNVYLTGEGFFKVTHQQNHQKFNVHTNNNVIVEVLGTEFNVNDRRSRTKVVLQSGKVRLDIKNSDQEAHDILMASGEYVEVSSEAIIRKQVNTDVYTSWQNRKITFKDTSLQDVLHLLEDNYGIASIVNDSTILLEKFTATYPSDDSAVLVKALERSFKIQLDEGGKRLVVGTDKKTGIK